MLVLLPGEWPDKHPHLEIKLTKNNKGHGESREFHKKIELYEQEIHTLRNQIDFYKHTNHAIKEQYELEKRDLVRKLKKLEEKVQILDQYGDVDVCELLNQLEEEVDKLKKERREDRRIISQV